MRLAHRRKAYRDGLWTNFSEYTTGVQPSDWTARWETGDAASTVVDGSGFGALGDKCLKTDHSADDAYAISWDKIGSVADLEILARVRWADSGLNNVSRIVFRGSGSGGSENGLMSAVYDNSNQIALLYYSAGSVNHEHAEPFTFAHDTWYWIRVNADGETVKIRVWADGDAEPGTWNIEVSSLTSGITGAGWAGFGSFRGNATYCDYFSVGLDGASAPSP